MFGTTTKTFGAILIHLSLFLSLSLFVFLIFSFFFSIFRITKICSHLFVYETNHTNRKMVVVVVLFRSFRTYQWSFIRPAPEQHRTASTVPRLGDGAAHIGAIVG